MVVITVGFCHGQNVTEDHIDDDDEDLLVNQADVFYIFLLTTNEYRGTPGILIS